MPRTVNQLIGIAARVGKAGTSTVVDYTGTVQIYDGNWRTDENVKFVLTPSAAAPAMALLAAAIGKRLELAGTFQQDDAPGTNRPCGLGDECHRGMTRGLGTAVWSFVQGDLCRSRS